MGTTGGESGPLLPLPDYPAQPEWADAGAPSADAPAPAPPSLDPAAAFAQAQALHRAGKLVEASASP